MPMELIQAGGETSVCIYHALCVKIWNSIVWPDAWKRSIHVPILKVGNLKLWSNYCTIITLISYVNKHKKNESSNLNYKKHGLISDREKAVGTIFSTWKMTSLKSSENVILTFFFTCFIVYSEVFDCSAVKTETYCETGFPSHTSLIHLI